MTVYCYTFSLEECKEDEFFHFLSSKEVDNSFSYLVDHARKRYVISRGILRCLLGFYLKIPPRDVHITQNVYGKPQTEGVYFNVSHSNELIVLCLSKELEVGIDIEKISSYYWSEEAEALLFSRKERDLAVRLSSSERQNYFFLVWTKKEAWLKGMGIGIPADLTAYDTQSNLRSWCFFQLCAPDPYVACLATQKKETHVINCSTHISQFLGKSAKNYSYL